MHIPNKYKQLVKTLFEKPILYTDKKNKPLLDILFNGISHVAILQSIDYVSQIQVPVWPSKEIALTEDYLLWTIQSAETCVDLIPQKFPQSKLTKFWYYVERYGIPLALIPVGVSAIRVADMFYKSHFDPSIFPSLGSDVAFFSALFSQFLKNRIGYK